MDGAFVAYHNTRDLYGIEYIDLEKIIGFVYNSKQEYEFNFEMGLQSFAKIIDFIKEFHDTENKIVICFNANIPEKLANKLVVMELPLEMESKLKEIPSKMFEDAFQLLG